MVKQMKARTLSSKLSTDIQMQQTQWNNLFLVRRRRGDLCANHLTLSSTIIFRIQRLWGWPRVELQSSTVASNDLLRTNGSAEKTLHVRRGIRPTPPGETATWTPAAAGATAQHCEMLEDDNQSNPRLQHSPTNRLRPAPTFDQSRQRNVGRSRVEAKRSREDLQ